MGILVDQLRAAAAAHPGETAWRNLGDGSRLSLADWDAESNRVAHGLVDRGVAKGDTVAIRIPPAEPFRWLIAYAATHKAGAVAVPINTRLASREVDAILDHAEIKVTFSAETFDDLRSDDASDIQVPVGPDDLADVMYTSGTTGQPKGVAVRHGAVDVRAVERWTGMGMLTCSPFTTTSGILLVYGPLGRGVSGWYLPRFDAEQWLENVARERPVSAFIVPAMAQLIVAHPRFATADLSSLISLTIGSAPIASWTLRRLQRRMPHAQVGVGYGMTELGAATAVPLGDGVAHLGSVGTALEGVELRVVDEDGLVVGAGEVGEIHIRRAGWERSYFKDPVGSAETWHAGWLRTGDLGSLDADGFLWVVGRKKDMVIRGGNNIYPGEVEAALAEHPAVLDVAVTGIAHEVLGEDVAAWVVVRPGSCVTGEDLRGFLQGRLADYKVPRRYTFVDDLPRNEAGKVVKRDLRLEVP
jgi:long-chain acyl-CoA synthetase